MSTSFWLEGSLHLCIACFNDFVDFTARTFVHRTLMSNTLLAVFLQTTSQWAKFEISSSPSLCKWILKDEFSPSYPKKKTSEVIYCSWDMRTCSMHSRRTFLSVIKWKLFAKKITAIKTPENKLNEENKSTARHNDRWLFLCGRPRSAQRQWQPNDIASIKIFPLRVWTKRMAPNEYGIDGSKH